MILNLHSFFISARDVRWQNIGFIDHAFIVPTSQYSLDDVLNKSRDIHGFYDGKDVLIWRNKGGG